MWDKASFFVRGEKVVRDSNFSEDQLTIVFVHPSRLFVEALSALLKEKHYKIVHQSAGSGSVFFPADQVEGKVVFVVGGRTPSDIVELVKGIRSQQLSAYILVINASTEPNEVMVALEAGADGYLRDAISSQTFVRVIELIGEDETILPPDFVRSLRESRDTQPEAVCNSYQEIDSVSVSPAAAVSEETSAGAKLSAREGLILRGLVDGSPNKVIAQRLHITEATVKVHVKAILRKIRVKNRTQAAIWATRHLSLAELRTSDHANPLCIS